MTDALLAADASPWIARFAPLARRGEALDLACGSGRHARLLAALGHPVVALDRDPEALAAAAGPGITTMAFDLEDGTAPWPFEEGRFAVIVVTNYLHRPLIPALVRSLAPGGLLIYETFAGGNEAFGRPSNPAFLLHEGELLRQAAAHHLRVLAFEDGFTSLPKAAMVQRLCACGADFAREDAHLDGGAAATEVRF
ncbi:methyltransferase domain-containing protein [Massilia sp. CCM 8733]|uniref:Methyltransferase domain-containing protein n=1 Tax=Massilia mucilaginosa TaxID=2609282 RepID=A0ABX0NNW3_9BURK|nr:class I SAM-dependent methyltransferase [Massilia mucilaginosa]NHZ88471.1 methyltransferase domain-containing protein [Massilia mucilaginosa]